MHADLVIVGAGMVGSALALALEGSGLEVLLVDGGSLDVAPFKPEAPYEPRVSALSEASRRILQRLHAWDGIVARRAEPYREMQVWDGSGTDATVLLCDVDLQRSEHVRRIWPFLRDRRIDAYGDLLKRYID